jgi:hypothetical protein
MLPASDADEERIGEHRPFVLRKSVEATERLEFESVVHSSFRRWVDLLSRDGTSTPSHCQRFVRMVWATVGAEQVTSASCEDVEEERSSMNEPWPGSPPVQVASAGPESVVPLSQPASHFAARLPLSSDPGHLFLDRGVLAGRHEGGGSGPARQSLVVPEGLDSDSRG